MKRRAERGRGMKTLMCLCECLYVYYVEKNMERRAQTEGWKKTAETLGGFILFGEKISQQ